jgi:hypothetical protein
MPAVEAIADQPAELVRIAGELGISPAHVQQAIAEVRGRPAGEDGLLARLVGEARVTASRLVSVPPAGAREQLDRYLTGREAMVAQRRLPDRTIYERGSGVGAAVTRAAGAVAARHSLLNVPLLEVAVDAVDDRSCFVAVSVDLNARRSATAAGTAAGALAGSAAAATVGVVLAPPLALIGLPVLAGFAYLMRASYRGAVTRTRTQLESLLDRLEHKELIDPGQPGLLRRFGF